MRDDDAVRKSFPPPRAPRRAIQLQPAHPERVCWGCDKLCPADSLACGNGTIRTLHPIELFGADWAEWFERHRHE